MKVTLEFNSVEQALTVLEAAEQVEIAKQVAESTPKTTPAPTPEPKPEPTPAPVVGDLKETLKVAVAKIGADKARALMGYDKLTDVPLEKHQAVIEKLDAAIAEVL